jgi:hypothetical protein
MARGYPSLTAGTALPRQINTFTPDNASRLPVVRMRAHRSPPERSAEQAVGGIPGLSASASRQSGATAPPTPAGPRSCAARSTGGNPGHRRRGRAGGRARVGRTPRAPPRGRAQGFRWARSAAAGTRSTRAAPQRRRPKPHSAADDAASDPSRSHPGLPRARRRASQAGHRASKSASVAEERSGLAGWNVRTGPFATERRRRPR